MTWQLTHRIRSHNVDLINHHCHNFAVVCDSLLQLVKLVIEIHFINPEVTAYALVQIVQNTVMHVRSGFLFLSYK